MPSADNLPQDRASKRRRRQVFKDMMAEAREEVAAKERARKIRERDAKHLAKKVTKEAKKIKKSKRKGKK